MQSADYHLVGVAGTGMNALAQLLLARGHAVSGSDRSRDAGLELPVLRKLETSGMSLTPQNGAAVQDGTGALVVSSAIESDNPDLLAAKEKGVPVYGRGEMLAKLANAEKCLAVAGTSGKTTVTGMVGWILEALGADPTVVNGGSLVGWVADERIGNVRIGQSNLWVVEVDESDRSLLEFRPECAVITNVSRDHFDVKESDRLFAAFCDQVKGDIVRGADEDPGPVDVIESSFLGSSFVYDGVPFSISLPGRHNIQNAVSAIRICRTFGHDLSLISDALGSFKGIERRLETIGTARGVTVVDDYAHNPAKIRAAWESAAPYFERVVAAWRPHGYGPLRAMMAGLVDTFSDVCRGRDQLFLLPVYYAGGTADRGVGSQELADALAVKGVNAAAVADYETCADSMASLAQDGDVVVSMGARDPGLPGFARLVLDCLGRNG